MSNRQRATAGGGAWTLRALVWFYLLVFVGLPLVAAVPPLLREPLRTTLAKVTSPQAVAAIALSAKAAAVGGAINAVMGTLLAWTLVRVRFPLRRAVDALVDLPFAVPAVVAGIALMALYGPASPVGQFLGRDGWFGQRLVRHGFAPLSLAGSFAGLVVANLFVTLPFVVRTVQPVIASLETESEDAAASLGATPLQVFCRVTLPQIAPAALTGFGLAFARGVNEYGIAVLISGNIPFHSLVGPVYLYQRLDAFDYNGATAIAVVLTTVSLGVLLATYAWNQWRQQRVA